MMREEKPSPNASPPLEELHSSPSPRRGKRSCSCRASHRRASSLPMREPREPLPSRRRGTHEREPSVWSPSQLKSKFYKFDKERNRWKERTTGTVKFPKNKVTSKNKIIAECGSLAVSTPNH
ncbi:ran-specific GTPase-activating protein 1-like isoform X2 [Arachis ipaensis]|uniref:uncharacterized protein n=1 Tax=Arachis hypogaea TaxID=3818 RepID=UPI0007AF8AFD|nr:ran-specific GTPase-activating protein 1-like isoform X2 [Arachis ipaensis]XP_020974389.1 ran-specific GTPase-activating protein 1-like isoform X2 [Arachis ipaensis]